ncbi:MAG: hypothetical protein H0T42_26160 [Deltaproteobacteria bacterium]|nr:hypothetical protein [Deltaproteobacteria bacterium]
MKRITILVTTLALTLAAGCKGKDKDAGGGAAGKTAEPGKAADTAKGPTLTINEADWVEKDLTTVSPMIHVTMKVPKDAKLEKNGNGGVDITLAPHYVITVSNMAVSNAAEALANRKALTLEHTGYINGKVLTEEPNGFIYTMQMKTEENGNTYQPEVHWAVALDKEGAIYLIYDERSMDGFSTPGSAWSEALAKQVYAIVKASAKAT